MVLAYLSSYQGNYANALRKLPRGIALMFIHAVQAQIFNEELEERAKSGNFESQISAHADSYGFPDMEKVDADGAFPAAPLVGYETKEEQIGECARRAMEKLQINGESFRIKSMPELAMRGAYRALLAPVKDLSFGAEDSSVRLAFSLPKGSYATVLLDEFVKNQ